MRLTAHRVAIAFALVIALAGVIVGCSGGDGGANASARNPADTHRPGRAGQGMIPPTAVGTRDTVRPSAPKDTVEARPVTWDLTIVRQALLAGGLRAGEVADSVRQPFLQAPGVVLTLPGADLQVYIYGDAVARGRDTDRLDTARIAPPATMVTWRRPATLITDNNLAAILLTEDTVLRRRVRQALLAHMAPIHHEIEP